MVAGCAVSSGALSCGPASKASIASAGSHALLIKTFTSSTDSPISPRYASASVISRNCVKTSIRSWRDAISAARSASARNLPEAAGANLLLTHHPMMFSARKRMTEMDTEGRLLCRMIRGRMGLIAAHTNWDRAPGGINDTLAAALGLTGVTGEGFLRAGDLPEALTAGELSALVSERLKTPVRPMAQWPAERRARRVAVCGGAGSELWEEALALGAEVFVVGEMKHHHALLAADAGMLALEAGHFATEEPGIFALADALQKALNAVQCSIPFTRSEAGGYACPGAR